MRRHVRERLRTGLFVERMRRDARQGILAVQNNSLKIIPSQYWYSKHEDRLSSSASWGRHLRPDTAGSKPLHVRFLLPLMRCRGQEKESRKEGVPTLQGGVMRCTSRRIVILCMTLDSAGIARQTFRCRNGQQRCARGVDDCKPANPWRVLIMQLSRWEPAKSRWKLETGRSAFNPGIRGLILLIPFI
ncbi:hypothetical protein M430DRAFT_235288 [Amorphotheca resinae ATCC 22711]|uniref:Uncharacterized protein n=1 Tax=Amorphotheca resinae ATCC 22711 TaxID=857342 RepID=A0A2T3B4J0_AMORE|nr:hypothetical protein M430DRAFT_235288 [Amorphotheca resinae ATCC 22711]PSS20550.1 hypothetical protein M430DRAFT_235288 [Amorphotheca resinae ATCC 22711]